MTDLNLIELNGNDEIDDGLVKWSAKRILNEIH